MADIETIVPYALSDYEEAAFLLSEYFLKRGYQAETYRSKERQGGYSALISRQGFLKNLLGSRTGIEVSFYPLSPSDKLQDKPQNQLQDQSQKTKGQTATRTDKELADSKSQHAFKKSTSKQRVALEAESTGISIRSGFVWDGVFKEALTYVTVIPALRKLGDYITMRDKAKRRSLIVCQILRIQDDKKEV